MTHRERVIRALNFQDVDRVPMDLGGMDSTGISAFAYPKLVQSLSLSPRLPYVHDTNQMLALPDLDVLNSLDCDVITVRMGFANGYTNDVTWENYDFGGRLDAKVINAKRFYVLEDGTVTQPDYHLRMPKNSYVFDSEHGGQPVYFEGELPELDLGKIKEDLLANRFSDEIIQKTINICEKVYKETDRALFLNGPMLGIGIGNFGGLGYFPLLCLVDEEKVKELHELMLNHAISELERFLPKVAPYIHVYMCNADDWGTQNNLIASPDIFKKLFLPYYREFNRYIHSISSGIKTFFHSCGAIYDIIDLVIESEFDVLNPVQWTAGNYSVREWKEKCKGKLVLWGGGIDTQKVLPLGTVDDVKTQVSEVVPILAEDSGYVFCAIHNILAEIDPLKIMSIYRTAKDLKDINIKINNLKNHS
ncbi:MAG TPA: uroporphyrinogen decarboxylase family protein [Candidatus Hydrogenedens sp.]|nr:uroporphyrinogen decarboxylase family protein [Candidatus Hydrogenedens sp.]HOL21040.1 uroporphyrinogen decarboxylase family protein [Candidatus Hydrogenedens sp.]HPP59135.1 uroporphyrinogen decarboxylase family protein [Candidatus Hydrogenedens sp.]